MSDYDYVFNYLLLGDNLAGKTSLLYNYIENDINTYIASTLGTELRCKGIKIDDKTVKLQIWDTCGPEKYIVVLHPHYIG